MLSTFLVPIAFANSLFNIPVLEIIIPNLIYQLAYYANVLELYTDTTYTHLKVAIYYSIIAFIIILFFEAIIILYGYFQV